MILYTARFRKLYNLLGSLHILKFRATHLEASLRSTQDNEERLLLSSLRQFITTLPHRCHLSRGDLIAWAMDKLFPPSSPNNQ